jgi:hypothetical protein
MPDRVDIAFKREEMGDRHCALTKFASMNDYEEKS